MVWASASNSMVAQLAADGGAALINTKRAEAGAVARSVQAVLRGVCYLADFDVTGDGVADDVSKIQAALDSGQKYILGDPSHIYRVTQTGTKTIDAIVQRFCLELPPGVVLDLNGATLKLGDAENAAIVINKNAGTSQDVDVALINGWLDGNQANQTTPATGEMSCVFLYDCLRPVVHTLKAKNVRQYAGRFLKCSDVYFNHLRCLDSDGDGWSFGVSGANNLFGGFIDNIFAEACAGAFGTLVGNGIICTAERIVFGKGKTVNCAAGIKIQAPTIGLSSYGQLTFIGGALGTLNSGIKVQGQVALQDVGKITIGQIVTELSNGEGLFITECKNVQVGSWISFKDAKNFATSAGRIDSTAENVQIGAVNVQEAGAGAIDCRATNVSFGSVVSKNNGQLLAGQANFTVSSLCDGLHIGKLLSIDDQGTKTVSRGLNIVTGCKNITIDDYHSRGDYTTAGGHLVNSDGATNLQIGRYRIDDNELYEKQVNSGSAGNVGVGEDDLLSLTVPARSLYKNGNGYRIKAWGFTANNANVKTLRLKVGTQTLVTTVLTPSQASTWEIEATVVRKAGNTQAFITKSLQGGVISITDLERGDAAQTDTAAIIVKVTGDATSDNDIAMRGMTLEPLR